jgi:polygalacturonase
MKRFLLLGGLHLAAQAALASEIVDVKAHGASGDGTTLDTTAIQSALDACAGAGGGRVTFPAGRYLAGSLKIPGGVTLVVTPDATIVGSTNMADYPHGPLLGAANADRIGIEGGGTIDGRGPAFWERKDAAGEPAWRGPPWRGTAQFEYRALRRPRFLHFSRCTNVVVRDVRLTDSPSWTLHLERCVTAAVDRVTIRNPLFGPNTDGIDLNSCIAVRVSRCDIVTGDDGVVLKSNEPGHDHPSRDIVVEDCRIWSACNAFKIGTETHDRFDGIVFRNSHVYSDSARTWDRALSGVAIESVDGSHLDGITVSNITMDNIRTPLFIRLGHRGGNSEKTRQVEPRVPGTIRNVVLRDIRARRSMFESSIHGLAGHPVQEVTLANLDLEYEGGGTADWVTDDVPDDEVKARYPEAQMFGRLPAFGLYVRHASGVRLSNVALRCTTPDARPAVVCEDVHGLAIDRLSVAAAPPEFPVLWFKNVHDVVVRGCAAPARTAVFLAIEGDGGSAAGVKLEACDLVGAKQAVLALPPGGLLAVDLPILRERAPGLWRIEAEDMRLTAPMQIVADPSLRSGRCIHAPEGSARDTGAARCRFAALQSGRFVVWVRVFAPSGEANSFHIAMDRGPSVLCDVTRLGAWHWMPVRDRTNAPAVRHAFLAGPGEHVLVIRNRESGTRIDAVAVVPAGLGVDPDRDLDAD